MAKLKTNRVYRSVKKRNYTRKKYIKKIPVVKINKYFLGSLKQTESSFTFLFLSEKNIYIRSNSIEAARVSLTKYLNKICSSEQYFYKFHVYPHQILRENKLATGAGADRVSSGMRLAFGKPTGLACRLNKSSLFFSLKISKKVPYQLISEGIKKFKSKLPLKFNILEE